MKSLNFFLAIALLGSASLNAITDTIVIDTPGHYLYSGPMSGDPDVDNSAMIKIAASNVTVDFGGYIFDQVATNTQINYTGIVIQAGLNNVTIQNGTLGALKGRGISIGDGCSEISFKNLIITDCRDAGVSLNGAHGINEVSFADCKIGDIQAVNVPVSACISVTKCSKLTMERCRLEGLSGSPQNLMAGLYCVSVQAAEIVDCAVVQINGQQFSAGFGFISCSDITLRNCIAYNCTVSGGDIDAMVSGFYFDACARFWLHKCQSVGNRAQNGFCYGYYLHQASQAICESSHAQLNGGSNDTLGIYLSDNEKTYIADCIIRGNQSSNGLGYGIYIYGGNNCYIQHNTIMNTASALTSYGIRIQDSGSCSIEHNTVSNSIGRLKSFGIVDEANASTSLVIGNYAFNNGTNYRVNYPNEVKLAVIDGSLSNKIPGLPSGAAGAFGAFDNISIVP